MKNQIEKKLLKIYQSSDTRFASSRALELFSEQYNLGLKKGASIHFSAADKCEIGLILHGEMGIDPITTTHDSWDSLDRAQSLRLSHNEKLSGRTIGLGRLRLKSLSEHSLCVAGGCWQLPMGGDLGVSIDAVVDSDIGHNAFLIVENLQTFQDIHLVDTRVMNALTGLNPLVLYRGDPQGGARADAVHSLIERSVLPVYAFVDYDPAGMIIAASLPRLDKILAPDLHELFTLIRDNGIVNRYLDQVAAANHVIHQFSNNPCISQLWQVIHAAGKALPQEFFHSEKIPNALVFI